MKRITIHPAGTEFDCADDDTILRAALRAGHGMPYSCNVGSCGNCRFELVEGAVTHLRADPPAWSERDLKRNRWLGCQARPEGPCTIKFRENADYVARHKPRRRSAELVSVAALTRDISEFAFEVEGPDDFLPGQYALISIPGLDGGRAYSMCNLPGEGVWRFQIKRVPGGGATAYLFDEARPGAKVGLDGPYGTAYLKEDSPRDIILMAGGSGLSPMMSIARGAAAAGLLADREMHFYYGCRSPADLFDETLFGEELRSRMSFTAAVSDPCGSDEWSGARGFLHDVVHEARGETLKDHEIYFAGPAIMSAAVQKMAHQAGAPMDQLHFDEFY